MRLTDLAQNKTKHKRKKQCWKLGDKSVTGAATKPEIWEIQEINNLWFRVVWNGTEVRRCWLKCLRNWEIEKLRNLQRAKSSGLEI